MIHSPEERGHSTRPESPKSPIDAVIELLESGNLDSAIEHVDQLLAANAESEELGLLRIRMAILRARLLAAEADRPLERSRLRVHFTQLSKIDQLHWVVIDRKARELLTESSSVPAAELEALLDQVRSFQSNQGDFIDGWLLQARLALLLDRVPEGMAAAFNLDQLGAWETTNAALLQTLQLLDERDWWFTINSK